MKKQEYGGKIMITKILMLMVLDYIDFITYFNIIFQYNLLLNTSLIRIFVYFYAIYRYFLLISIIYFINLSITD